MADSLTIHAIQSRIMDYPLRLDQAIVSSAGRHDASRYLLVTVQDSDGRRGYGEAATSPNWSGETAVTAQHLVDHLLAPLLVGRELAEPAAAVALMDTVLIGNSFVKSAIDCAIWDLWARRQSCSVASLIADRPLRTHIPIRASVGCYPPAKSAELALRFRDLGVRTLKFKIGVPGVDDPARLRAAREAVGSDITFTVDANCAYATADIAERAISDLLPYNLQLVEQPTPRSRLDEMAALRRRLPVPILADESIFTPDDLELGLALAAFDLLSIYPGKNGGFTHALRMSKRAHAAGIGCAIGSNLESRLGEGAMLTLAAALQAFDTDRHACDFQAVLFYPEPTSSPEPPLTGGAIPVPDGPGFGVEPVQR